METKPKDNFQEHRNIKIIQVRHKKSILFQLLPKYNTRTIRAYFASKNDNPKTVVNKISLFEYNLAKKSRQLNLMNWLGCVWASY